MAAAICFAGEKALSSMKARLLPWHDCLPEGSESTAGKGLDEHLAVDIAAGGDDGHGLARCVKLAAEHRGRRRGAAGLDHQLELGEGDGDGAQHLLVADREPAGEEAAVDGEGDLA